MQRTRIIASAALALVMAAPAVAQPERGVGKRTPGGERLPEVGSQLPVVSLFDAQGLTFSTATLRGSYTVLVFGCLT